MPCEGPAIPLPPALNVARVRTLNQQAAADAATAGLHQPLDEEAPVARRAGSFFER